MGAFRGVDAHSITYRARATRYTVRWIIFVMEIAHWGMLVLDDTNEGFCGGGACGDMSTRYLDNALVWKRSCYVWRAYS